jgi:putative transposase
MSQSFAKIIVHLVFSTKNRESWLVDEIRDELHAYIGGIVEDHKGTLIKSGSVADHIHLLITHPRTISPAKLVQELKTGSYKWLKTKGERFSKFSWQTGYGIFSVSPSHRSALEAYITNQAEHHRKVSFQDEYRRLLGNTEFNLMNAMFGIELDAALSGLEFVLAEVPWALPRAIA